MADYPPMGYTGAQQYLYPQAKEFTPFFPNMGQFGQQNPGTASLIQMAVTAMGGGTHAMLGTNDQNLYDRFEQNRMSQQHFAIMQKMAAQDADRISDTVRGAYMMVDRPYDQGGQDFAASMAKGWETAGPIMTMMAPKMASSILGGRSHVAFSHYAEMATRQRIDPLTGYYGLDADRAAALQGSVFHNLFDGAAGQGVAMTDIEAGQLWNSLQSQGLSPRTSRIEDLAKARSSKFAEAMNDLGLGGRDLSSLNPDERSKLMTAPKVQEELKAFDSTKVSDTLKQWGKSIDALREIFGDAGMPDAPVPVLMNALRQLSGGNISQINPSELSLMVRTYTNLAQGSGLGLEGATMLSQVAQQQGQSLGLPDSFGMRATMGGMSFMQAFNALGKGSEQGFGMPDVARVTEMRTKLNLSAVASPLGNQMGLARLIQKDFGVTGDNDMQRYLKALDEGATTFTNMKGENTSISMMSDQFAAMIAGSGNGISVGEAQIMLTQTRRNLGGLHDHPGDMRSAAGVQREQTVSRGLLPTVQTTFGTELSHRIADQPGTGALSLRLSRAFSDAIFDPKKFQASWIGDEKARFEGLGGEMYKSLVEASKGTGAEADAAKAMLASGSEADVRGELKKMAFTGWGQGEQFANQRGTTLFGLQMVHDSETQTEAGRAESLARGKGMMEDMLSKAGRGGVVRKFFESMQKADRSKDLKTLVKDSFGANAEDVMSAMKAAGMEPGTAGGDKFMKEFQENYDTIKSLHDEMVIHPERAAAIERQMADRFGTSGQVIEKFLMSMDKAHVDLGAMHAEEGTLGFSDEGLKRIIKGGAGDSLKKKLDPVRKNLEKYLESDANKRRLGEAGVKELSDMDKELEGLSSGSVDADTAKKKIVDIEDRLQKTMKTEDEKKSEESKTTKVVVESTHLYVDGKAIKTSGARIVTGDSETA
jgi:hypothetical protein